MRWRLARTVLYLLATGFGTDRFCLSVTLEAPPWLEKSDADLLAPRGCFKRTERQKRQSQTQWPKDTNTGFASRHLIARP